MNKKFILSFLWLGFTTALGSWWVYFSYLQYNSLKQSSWEHAADTLRYQRMLILEGSFFLVLVVLGGGALVYFTLKENQRLKEKEAFFSAFSHDLKTTITNLKITLESILQKKSEVSSQDIKRLFNESHRLSLQLENALLLARQKDIKAILNKVSLTSTIAFLKQAWPELEVRLSGNIDLYADSVLLTSVISNILQNAKVHGDAKTIDIKIEKPLEQNKIQILISNDGKIFEGDYERLGAEYFSRGQYSGSGLGLFISKTLMRKMQGDLNFKNRDGQFCAVLSLTPYVK